MSSVQIPTAQNTSQVNRLSDSISTTSRVPYIHHHHRRHHHSMLDIPRILTIPRTVVAQIYHPMASFDPFGFG